MRIRGLGKGGRKEGDEASFRVNIEGDLFWSLIDTVQPGISDPSLIRCGSCERERYDGSMGSRKKRR